MAEQVAQDEQMGEPASIGESPNATSYATRRLNVVFAVLTLGIIGAGFVYIWNQEQHHGEEVRRQLAAIAELKVGELVQFRRERLGDGLVLLGNPALVPLVRRVLDSRSDEDGRQQLHRLLAGLMSGKEYADVHLLDPQGIPRLSLPVSQSAVSATIARSAVEVLRTGQVTFQDFHRSERDQRVHLAVLVPILDGTNRDRPLGVIVLQIDPERYVYPFIRRWPVPSRTAETLLSRREGQDVVFLNELRFQDNSALTLLVPMSNTALPSVRAALGHTGFVEGTDYRGVSVLAHVQAVPDSPWFLMARRDVEEILEPMRAQRWGAAVLFAVLLLGAYVGVASVSRQERRNFYRAETKSAEALRSSLALQRAAERVGRVGGWEFDIATRQVTWTDMVYEIHGFDRTNTYTVDDGIRHYTPESRPIIEQAVQRAIEHGEPFDLQLDIVTPKGELRHVRAVGERDEVRGVVSGSFHDVTPITRASIQLAESEASHRALFASNPHAMWVYDLETLVFLEVNDAAIAAYGYSRDEFLAMTIADIRPAEDVPRLLENVAHVVAGCEAIEHAGLWRHRTKDGRILDVDITSHTLTFLGRRAELVTAEDCTERQRVDAARRTAERNLTSMVDGLSDHLVVLDELGTIILTNRAFRDFGCANGLAPHVVFERTNYLAVCDAATGPHSAEAKHFAEGIREVIAGKRQSFAMEYPCHSPDEKRWFIGRVTVFADDGSRRVVVAHTDITQRRLLELDRQKFFLLAESSREFIGMCDLDMTPLYVNPAGRRMVGLPDMAAACRVKVQDYYFPEDQRFIAEDFFPRVLRDGHGEVEIRLRHFQTGAAVWVSYSLFRLDDASGTGIGWATVSSDITELKKVQDDAVRMSRLMKDAQEIAHLGSFEYIAATQTTNWSEEEYRIYGLDPDGPSPAYEVMLERCIHPEDAKLLHETFAAAMQHLGVYELEHRIVRPDGSVRWVHDKAHPELDRDGNLVRYVGATLDITDRRLAGERLTQLNEELEQRVQDRTSALRATNENLESFSHAVSHDLRAPLRHIRGYVDLLTSRHRENLPESARHYLDQVGHAARQMSALVDELLAFSRAGRSELHQMEVDMNAVIRDVRGRLEAELEPELQAELNDRTIAWSVAELPRIRGDVAAITQVWTNLLANGVKYTRRTERAQIAIGATRMPGYWEFFVRDNGAGFDMEYAHKLFGVFQRLHSQEDFEGVGIGLANVRQIVHKHGGTVRAEGKRNQGATFFFTIPDNIQYEGGIS